MATGVDQTCGAWRQNPQPVKLDCWRTRADGGGAWSDLGLTQVTAHSIGRHHACVLAILGEQGLVCWGEDVDRARGVGGHRAGPGLVEW